VQLIRTADETSGELVEFDVLGRPRGFLVQSHVHTGQVERYDIDLWFTSKVFAPGHRLRVSITSALFPKYDRNLNTGGNNERDSTFVIAHQRLIHDAAHQTHVVLPVVPR
jgi:predicted acyl esterase